MFEHRLTYLAAALTVQLNVGCAGSGGPPAVAAPAATAEPTPSPAPSAEPPGDVAGAWTGRIGEEGLEYQVCMEIGPTPASPNPIQYFGDLNCSGTARFVSSSGSVHTFAELLTVGNDTDGGQCATTGRIEARLNSDGSLDWRWFDPDDNSPRVTSLLQRQPACP